MQVLYSSETVVHFCESQRPRLPDTSTFYFRMFDVVVLNFRLFNHNNERHMRVYRTHCLRLIMMLIHGCEESAGTSVTSHHV